MDGVRLRDGTRVRYVDRGDRSADQAVVLIHGWSCDHQVWRGQIDALAESGRVIALDLPGHGASDRPEVEYSMPYLAGAVAEICDAAEVRRAVLVGHSNGTPVARQFYRMFSERTAGIVVVDGALRPMFPDLAAAERFIARMSGPGRKAFLEEFAGRVVPTVAGAESRELVRNMILSAPERVQVSSFRGAVDPAIWTPDVIDAPVLVVVAASPFWGEEYERFVRRLSPRVEYHEMTGVGHFLMMDRPDEFNRLLLDWLRREKLVGSGVMPG
jgi:pimeloyl-ACP methyl ester carboxylesterase